MREVKPGVSQSTERQKPARIPNTVRTESTRATLLDATITALARYGYKGATSQRIAQLSGLTRGAQKHHFATKSALFTEALVDLQGRNLRNLQLTVARGSDPDIGELLRLIWPTLTDDLYIASMELRMAARIDNELREALIPTEQQIGRRIREFLAMQLDDGRVPHERLLEVGEMASNALRGMALQRMLYSDELREKRQIQTLEESMREFIRFHTRQGPSA